MSVKVPVCHTIMYSNKCILKTAMIYELILIVQFVRCHLSLVVL